MYTRMLTNVLISAATALSAVTHHAGADYKPHPAVAAAKSASAAPATTAPTTAAPAVAAPTSPTAITSEVAVAMTAFQTVVRPLSRPEALNDAFHAYYSYKAAHPSDVKKPYLYFVDYGLPSTMARGWVFDMNSLRVIDGPFTVAHGRGSSTSQYGIPTKFSNSSGSGTTSLGLYVTKSTYAFTGHTGGQPYSSIGLRIDGVSTGFNDKALARGVVVHGAPYVTPTRAGRSEGCPAMEPARAQRLLPQLANGSLVFLFAPDARWLAGDPWIAANVG